MESREKVERKREWRIERGCLLLGARPQAENGGMIGGDQSPFHPTGRGYVGDEVWLTRVPPLFFGCLSRREIRHPWLPFGCRICSSTLLCCQRVNEHYHNPQRQREERCTIGRVQFRCPTVIVRDFLSLLFYDLAVESPLLFEGNESSRTIGVAAVEF